MDDYDRREDIIGEMRRTLPQGKWPRNQDFPDVYYDCVLWLIEERERLQAEVENLSRSVAT